LSLTKTIAIIGILLLALGTLFAFAPASREIWEPKSALLASETEDISLIGSSKLITYFFLFPEHVRNLKIRGYVKLVDGEPFSFEITNGEVYVKADKVSERSFEFSVEPEDLRDGLWLKMSPAKAKVSLRIEASWEEKTYAHVLGGMVLGGLLGFFGIILLIAAFILYIIQRPKITVTIKKE